jgi:predicted enzyme related to lactoylglutathione lyase
MPATLSAIVLDCADPVALAEFYRTATGWAVTASDEDWASLSDGGPIQLGFQRVDGYRPPEWPGPAKHAHVDLAVADLDSVAEELVAAGATRPEYQPGQGEWLVLVDPAGHPFCLTPGA